MGRQSLPSGLTLSIRNSCRTNVPVAGGQQKKTVFLSDECADGWRTAEKSVVNGEYVMLRYFYSPLELQEEYEKRNCDKNHYRVCQRLSSVFGESKSAFCLWKYAKTLLF